MAMKREQQKKKPDLLKPDDREKVYDDSIVKLSQLLCDLSIDDAGYLLFVSSIWLPNITSQIKHLFWATLFVSLESNQFRNQRDINKYEDFRTTLLEVYKLLPAFPELEDYRPECDWGDVKYHYKGTDYKIFYGSEIENTYDWLTSFEFLYCSMDDAYLNKSKRSPAAELKACLEMQDFIITEISAQQDTSIAKNVTLGHLDVPSSEFWNELKKTWPIFKTMSSDHRAMTNAYAIDIGSIRIGNMDEFYSSVTHGNQLSFFWVRREGDYIPILPRRYTSILFDTWGDIFTRYGAEIDVQNSQLRNLMLRMVSYLKPRMYENKLFSVVSPVDSNGKPHPIIFSNAILSGNKLLLVYIVPPSADSQEMKERLEELAEKLPEAVSWISRKPVRLGLNIDQMIVQFDSNNLGKCPEPIVFVVLPAIRTQITSVKIPEAFRNYQVMWLDQFLTLADEIEDVDELEDFLDYISENSKKTKSPYIGLVDLYASFKDSSGVLIVGAHDPNFIMIDPHWGSNYRYESLARFWSLYPNSGYFAHPRTWKVSQETATRIRLEARGYFGCALYSQVGGCSFFTNAPFDRMNYEQGQISNLLMESLEDVISSHAKDCIKLSLFSEYKQCQVSLFPMSLVETSDDLQHLRHLSSPKCHWLSEPGWIQSGVPGVRIVYNDKLVAKTLQESKNRSIEIELACEVLRAFTLLIDDEHLDEIISKLLEEKDNKPRYTLFEHEKTTSFPEFVREVMPNTHHYKCAAKRTAQIAKEINLEPGQYDLTESKKKLDKLRVSLVKEVEQEVQQIAYKESLLFLIQQNEAVCHKFERNQTSYEFSLQHDVDYIREERASKEKNEYIRKHRILSYLIEKVVQLEPNGPAEENADKILYILALVDKLLMVYHASDAIHYDILPVGVLVDEDFVVNVTYGEGLQDKHDEYNKENAAVDLGVLGIKEDAVALPNSTHYYLNELDLAFKKDQGFTLTQMLSLLAILSQWPLYSKGIKEACYYSSDSEEILHHCDCAKSLDGMKENELKAILNCFNARRE